MCSYDNLKGKIPGKNKRAIETDDYSFFAQEKDQRTKSRQLLSIPKISSCKPVLKYITKKMPNSILTVCSDS